MSKMKFNERRTVRTSRAALLAGCVVAGTGGISIAHGGGVGYGLPGVHYVASATDNYVGEQLSAIANSLRTTNAELARALGVSRQALYNWRAGQRPSSATIDRLEALSSAAKIISASSVVPKQALACINSDGQNFWQALAQGADAMELANKIVAGHNARESQRELVAARLAAKRSRGTLPIFDVDHLE